jgi:hypothetical protein
LPFRQEDVTITPTNQQLSKTVDNNIVRTLPETGANSTICLFITCLLIQLWNLLVIVKKKLLRLPKSY